MIQQFSKHAHLSFRGLIGTRQTKTPTRTSRQLYLLAGIETVQNGTTERSELIETFKRHNERNKNTYPLPESDTTERSELIETYEKRYTFFTQTQYLSHTYVAKRNFWKNTLHPFRGWGYRFHYTLQKT